MSDAADRLQQLKGRFLARCREDMAQLTDAALPEAALQLIAHRIAGLAGTFGLAELGEIARALDQRLSQQQPYAAERSALVTALTRLLE